MGWTHGNETVLMELPDELVLEDNSFEFATRFTQQAFRPGAFPTSSLAAKRPISVQGRIIAGSRAELAATEASLKKAAIRPHLALRDGDAYINLQLLKSFQWMWRELSDRCVADCRITWEAGDPFWYRYERQQHIQTIVITDDSFDPGYEEFTVTTDATLGGWPVYPEISLTAPSSPSDTIFPWILRNYTDDEAELTYSQSITTGNTISVRGESATVVGGNPAIGYLSYIGGQFIRLMPGANALLWEDSSDNLTFDMTFLWRERWF
jgi:hypothetical protein